MSDLPDAHELLAAEADRAETDQRIAEWTQAAHDLGDRTETMALGQLTHDLRCIPAIHVAGMLAVLLWERAHRPEPAGPADDQRIWVSTPRDRIDMHAISPDNPHATSCGRSTLAGGSTMRAADARGWYQSQPCPRCWPGSTS